MTTPDDTHPITTPATTFTDPAGMSLEVASQREYVECTARRIGFSSHGTQHPGERLWLYRFHAKHHRVVVVSIYKQEPKMLVDIDGLDLGINWISELVEIANEGGFFLSVK